MNFCLKVVSAIVPGVVVFLAIASSVQAHRPEELGGAPSAEATVVENPSNSTIRYVQLTEEVDTLRVKVRVSETGYPLFVQLGLPKIERLQDYRPSVAIVAPDKAFSPGSDTGGSEAGLWLFHSHNESDIREFHEPVTGTDSWILLERTVVLGDPGTYELVVWSPEGRQDKLWLALGIEERFGPMDIVRLPRWVIAVRSFHEVGLGPVWFLAALAVAGLGLGLVVAWTARRFLRRRAVGLFSTA